MPNTGKREPKARPKRTFVVDLNADKRGKGCRGRSRGQKRVRIVKPVENRENA